MDESQTLFDTIETEIKDEELYSVEDISAVIKSIEKNSNVAFLNLEITSIFDVRRQEVKYKGSHIKDVFETYFVSLEPKKLASLEERNKIVELNKYLVRFVMKRYRIDYDEYNDIEQEAFLGLIGAAEKYDGRCAFSTFAFWHIRSAISGYFNGQKENMVSLDEKTSDLDERTLLESLTGDIHDPDFLPSEVRNIIMNYKNHGITDREYLVLQQRYLGNFTDSGFDGNVKTLKAIAGILGISYEGTRKIESNVLRKLRNIDKIRELYGEIKPSPYQLFHRMMQV